MTHRRKRSSNTLQTDVRKLKTHVSHAREIYIYIYFIEKPILFIKISRKRNKAARRHLPSFSLVACRDEDSLPPSPPFLLGNVSGVKTLKPPSLKQEDRAGRLEQGWICNLWPDRLQAHKKLLLINIMPLMCAGTTCGI